MLQHVTLFAGLLKEESTQTIPESVLPTDHLSASYFLHLIFGNHPSPFAFPENIISQSLQLCVCVYVCVCVCKKKLRKFEVNVLQAPEMNQWEQSGTIVEEA